MLSEATQCFIVLIVALAAMNVVFNLATAIVGAFLGFSVNRVSVGVGPTLVKIPVGHATLALGLIPIAGYVNFHDANTRPELGALRSFANAGWLRKIVVALTGPISIIVAATALLGPSAISEAVMFWPQLARATMNVWAPLYVHDLIWPMVAHSGYVTATTVIAVKTASFNLLPLPVLNGGAILIAVVEGLLGHKLPERSLQGMYQVGLGFLLLIAAVILFRILHGVLA